MGRIAQVRWAEAGETVGYGATQTLKRRTRIATVCAGYADGFFRAFSASDAREGPPAPYRRHIGCRCWAAFLWTWPPSTQPTCA